jgi:hypothetical protein
LPHLAAAQRLQVLHDEGVKTLSADLLNYAIGLGLSVVSSVVGEMQEVVRYYWQNTLDNPKLWLPGCRGAAGVFGLSCGSGVCR